MSNYLDKIKQALESGNENAEINEHIKNIHEKADQISDPNAAFKERLEMLDIEETKITPKDIEKLEKVESEYLEKVKEGDNKWATLADIENMKTSLNMLENKYELLKSDYEEKIANTKKDISDAEKTYKDRYDDDNINIQ